MDTERRVRRKRWRLTLHETCVLKMRDMYEFSPRMCAYKHGSTMVDADASWCLGVGLGVGCCCRRRDARHTAAQDTHASVRPAHATADTRAEAGTRKTRGQRGNPPPRRVPACEIYSRYRMRLRGARVDSTQCGVVDNHAPQQATVQHVPVRSIRVGSRNRMCMVGRVASPPAMKLTSLHVLHVCSWGRPTGRPRQVPPRGPALACGGRRPRALDDISKHLAARSPPAPARPLGAPRA